MLSVEAAEASSGFTSTNQTATFGYSLSDTAEDAPSRTCHLSNARLKLMPLLRLDWADAEQHSGDGWWSDEWAWGLELS